MLLIAIKPGIVSNEEDEESYAVIVQVVAANQTEANLYGAATAIFWEISTACISGATAPTSFSSFCRGMVIAFLCTPTVTRA